MRCPKCKSQQVTIVDSRQEDDQVRRRRECLDCGERWSTIETTLKEFKRLKKAAGEECRLQIHRTGYL